MKKKTKKRLLSSALAFSILVTPMQTTTYTYAATCELTYEFSGDNAATTGYAEGTITFTAPSAGTYYLYWADDTKALDNYYEITSMTMNSGESKSYTFGYHTAIPAKATKLIAVTDKSKVNVGDAVAVYNIPWEKQLTNKGGNLLYTFNSYSDVHIDTEVYYTNSKTNWKNALKFAADMDTDFIVSSGDAVTNAKGFTEEWDVYEKILAESDYTKPVWETNGNHDMRDESSKDGQGVINGVKSYDYKGNLAFSKATGTDSTIANLSSNKPYYYVIEQNSGDLFIFMALENGHSPASYDNFSKEQINWLKDLLDTFYGTGINIYIIEHATFRGYGPGDIWTPKDNGSVSSYYSGHMYANGMKSSDGTTISGMDQNTEFKKLLETYKDVIWMSGHTHEDFSLGNNYTNENSTACNMIHNPAVVGTTYINEKGKLEYDSNSTANDGKGLNSQGYYVEAYENHVVYYGANLTEEKIYPAYCYIMEGSRYSEPVALAEDRDLIFPAHETLVPQKEVISADSNLTEAISITKNMLEKYYTYASYDQYQYLKKYYYEYKNNAVLADTKKAVTNLKYASGQLYAIIHGNVSGGDEQPISSTHFALRYYSNNTHGWDAIDTYFSKKGNGLYIYTYTAPNTNDISVNVYDTTKSGYHCVAESISTTFTDGLSEDYSLTGPTSSRGKSITIKGLNVGNQVTFLYNSNMNELTISFQASTDADVDAAIANAENNIPLHNLHKPVIDTTVTWDCVYYGNYPQTQITQENNHDVYNTLLTSKDWNENGDIIIGAEKYHRISKKDATSTALYTWEDSNVYHYFKYEPIKWRVLNVSDTEIYLLSDLVLDTQKMEQLPWTLDLENSTLQSWLNSSSKTMNDMEIDYSQNGFLNRAFTAEEQQHLLTSGNTNVNLLTLEKVSQNTAPDYGFISNDARKSLSSDYAKAMGVFFDAEGYSKWWLLTNGEVNVNALYVHTNGEITAKGVSLKSVQNGIRPAIHLRLENEPVYRYAGTVSSDGTQYLPTPTTTPTPSPTTITTVSAAPTPTDITSSPTPTATLTVTPTATPTVTLTVTPTAAPTVTLTVTPTTAPITQIPATSTPAPTISPIIIVQPTNAAVPTTTLPITVTVSPTTTPIVKKGTLYKDKKTKAIYKVTKTASKKAGTVQYVKPTNSNITTVTIPATIKINKKTYKVTSIAGKALQKKKKLKKVVIGKNVSSIGKNAFYGSKKLKLIQIKTTKLKAKKVGKNAFKGIHKKAKIIVPVKKQKAYEKILKSTGVGNNVKITH